MQLGFLFSAINAIHNLCMHAIVVYIQRTIVQTLHLSLVQLKACRTMVGHLSYLIS